MTNFSSLYYPLAGADQPQFAVMHRTLFCIVADANSTPGLSPAERYYVAEDAKSMTLLDHNGWPVAVLEETVDGYRLTSLDIPIRKRADSVYNSKSIIVSKSAPYIVEALQTHRRGLLTTNGRIASEVTNVFQGFTSHINHDIARKSGTLPSNVNVTLTGALVHVIGEVMNGRLTPDGVDPEHLERINQILKAQEQLTKNSFDAFQRQKTALNGEKWIVLSGAHGMHVGAFKSQKTDGAGAFRRASEILTIEPMRLYRNMDALREQNPAAFADISIGIADAIALARTTNVTVFRPKKGHGVSELPHPCVEEAGVFTSFRDSSENWRLMTDKRS